MALEQIDLLMSAGVPPDRILIGHMDRLLDHDHARQVILRGDFARRSYWPAYGGCSFTRLLGC